MRSTKPLVSKTIRKYYLSLHKAVVHPYLNSCVSFVNSVVRLPFSKGHRETRISVRQSMKNECEAESWGTWRRGNFAHLHVSGRTFPEIEPSCSISLCCSDSQECLFLTFIFQPFQKYDLCDLTVITSQWLHTGRDTDLSGPTSVLPSTLLLPAHCWFA